MALMDVSVVLMLVAYGHQSASNFYDCAEKYVFIFFKEKKD